MWHKRGATCGLCRLFQTQCIPLVSPLQSSSRVFLHHQQRYRLTPAACNATPAGLSSTGAAYTWVWNETENWCSLCREPLNSWNEHRGKRDHICLEMFYNALVQYGRRWTPATLWWEVEECTLLRRTSPPLKPTSLSFGEGFEGETYLDYVDAPTASKGGLSSLMNYYDRAEHYTRRLELYACIRHLADNGILRTDRAALTGGASFHGSLVTFKELFPNLVNMFPYADAKEISALTQMIASTYNSETVFDLCNFQALLIGGEQHQQQRQKDEGAEAAILRNSKEQQRGNVVADSAAGEHSYYWKGVFCRGVMGQLRWALEPDSVACPLQTSGEGGSGAERFSGHYWQVLAEHTCRALLAEMVFCRVSEYVVRVEGVWRQRGQEVARSPAAVCNRGEEDALLRLASNWGMVKYMDDRFYDASFGRCLPNDGLPKRRHAQAK
ncbi:hypothetical protein DQ04_05931020 [Trypanosoma grayi]|uniref:hypothetical protein n=1 Tax=Trypanosoma grayi TaxID=71804 RepID=UPI0004F43800|nr:hypothetical protein DQ04_05931020 [Trypanosoma grayi]KEG09042.1 hypothetical protein DQ04_05931020 [Trypanosoma grayi]